MIHILLYKILIFSHSIYVQNSLFPNFLVLHKFQKTVKKLLRLLTVYPMAGTRNIFKLSLGEELFDQVVISHRNVITVSPSNEERRTL